MQFGLAQADQYVEGLRDALRAISDHPLMARERDEIRPPIRLLPYRSHHIFYDVLEEGVVVVRVLHGTVDWIALL